MERVISASCRILPTDDPNIFQDRQREVYDLLMTIDADGKFQKVYGAKELMDRCDLTASQAHVAIFWQACKRIVTFNWREYDLDEQMSRFKLALLEWDDHYMLSSLIYCLKYPEKVDETYTPHGLNQSNGVDIKPLYGMRLQPKSLVKLGIECVSRYELPVHDLPKDLQRRNQ